MNSSKLISAHVPAQVQPGQEFPALFQFLNTGTTVWNPATGYKLAPAQDETRWNTQGRIELPHAVTPGGTVTVESTLKAPSKEGNYLFEWGMIRENFERFGEKFRKHILVGGVFPLPTPETISPGNLHGGIIINSFPYVVGRNDTLEIEWQNQGPDLQIVSSYIWTGAGGGVTCDSHLSLVRKSDGSSLNVLQWDRYAEPTAPNNSSYRQYHPHHFLLEGRDSLIMKALTYPLSHAKTTIHHAVHIWTAQD